MVLYHTTNQILMATTEPSSPLAKGDLGGMWILLHRHYIKGKNKAFPRGKAMHKIKRREVLLVTYCRNKSPFSKGDLEGL